MHHSFAATSSFVMIFTAGVTISNVALDVQWDYERVIGRVTLQIGHTPSTYYLSEPSAAGAGGANATGSELWKYLQQAYVGYRFALGRGLTVTAGLFLSPIGPESMAVRDNWNWSRSNLFFGLPFYHSGARASYALSDAWVVTLACYSGWNSVVDNNAEKSASAQLTYAQSKVVFSVLYFGGVERAPGSPEGRGWRHLVDTHVTWNAMSWLSLLAHANGGFEPTQFGASLWAASAIYARLRIFSVLYFVVRGDIFYEHAARNAAGRASRRTTQRQAAEALGLTARHLRASTPRFRRPARRAWWRSHAAAKQPGARRDARPSGGIVPILYTQVGPTLAREKLAEVHGLRPSVQTLRGRRQGASQRPRRRRDCLGPELVQIDGSDDKGFEDRGPRCTLLVYVDDATSRLLELRFVRSESTFDHLLRLANRRLSPSLFARRWQHARHMFASSRQFSALRPSSAAFRQRVFRWESAKQCRPRVGAPIA